MICTDSDPLERGDFVITKKKENKRGKFRRSILVPFEKGEGGSQSSNNQATQDSNKSSSKERRRRVGYSLVKAKHPQHRRNVIVWFYPFSGSSAILEAAAASLYRQPNTTNNLDSSSYQASVLMVDRPGIGDTDEYNVTRDNNNDNKCDDEEDYNDGTTTRTTLSSSSSISSITFNHHVYDNNSSYENSFLSSNDNNNDRSEEGKSNRNKKIKKNKNKKESTTSTSCDINVSSSSSVCNAASSIVDAAREVMTTSTKSLSSSQGSFSSSSLGLSSSWSSNIDRIQTHARDVIQVLKHHYADEISSCNVYIVGVCIGHVFAVEFARHMMLLQEEEGKEGSTKFCIRGMALQSPFVSTACSKGWRLARLGALVPSFVLNFVTHSMSALNDVMAMMTTRNAAKKEIGLSKRLAKEFGWRLKKGDDDNDDLEAYCALIRENNRRAGRHVRVIEAQLAVDPSWQVLVCDEFAKIYNNSFRVNRKNKLKKKFPITIYGSRNDEIATWESIEWLRYRCFGNDDSSSEVTLMMEKEEKLNHDLMTSFGGPPRNPVLLHDIVKKWGLLI